MWSAFADEDARPLHAILPTLQARRPRRLTPKRSKQTDPPLPGTYTVVISAATIETRRAQKEVRLVAIEAERRIAADAGTAISVRTSQLSGHGLAPTITRNAVRLPARR